MLQRQLGCKQHMGSRGWRLYLQIACQETHCGTMGEWKTEFLTVLCLSLFFVSTHTRTPELSPVSVLFCTQQQPRESSGRCSVTSLTHFTISHSSLGQTGASLLANHCLGSSAVTLLRCSHSTESWAMNVIDLWNCGTIICCVLCTDLACCMSEETIFFFLAGLVIWKR